MPYAKRPSFEDAYRALEACNGALRDAAKQLNCKIHTLKAVVDEHAELQALVRIRELELADMASDTLYKFMSDPDIPPEGKVATAKWIAENLMPDIYSKSQRIELNSARNAEDMTDEEFTAKIVSLRDRLKEAGVNFNE